MPLLVAAKYRLEAGAHKEVLLLEAEQPAMLTRVVGIEYLADGLDVRLEAHRLRIVTRVEGLQVEVLTCGLGAPDAQVVNHVSAIADEGDVIRQTTDRKSVCRERV